MWTTPTKLLIPKRYISMVFGTRKAHFHVVHAKVKIMHGANTNNIYVLESVRQIDINKFYYFGSKYWRKG